MFAHSRLAHYDGGGVGPTSSSAEEGAFVITREPAERRAPRHERTPRSGPQAPAAGSGRSHPSHTYDGATGGSGGSDTKDEDSAPPPPPTESSKPLVEANVPVVGTVKVEEPKLPDTEDVLPETPTVPLP